MIDTWICISKFYANTLMILFSRNIVTAASSVLFGYYNHWNMSMVKDIVAYRSK